ncbi:MAG TPA: helix-hairpin-helix domain-containing protein [Candidatus Polarisedimenticolaceae bacterium]|nr:helix-hairpin-helix domain-containing protein [Candidatus Polarisedimenticolaceae bacterium]
MIARRIAPALVLSAALAAVSLTAQPIVPPAAAAASAEAKPVDLNAAGSDELEAVPGIGKSLASKIVAFREKNGAFKTVDDLLKVQGVGEKSLEKLRPYLTVSKAK